MTTANASSDILILGAGVIGLTAAWYLVKEGATVTVVDRGKPGREASWAGAGILLPGNFENARSPLAKLLGLSSQLYPALSEELRNETGIDNEYSRCGDLNLAFDAKQEHALRSSAGRYRALGIQADLVTPDEARALEPALTPDLRGALHIPGVAQIRNPRHLKALIAGCHRRGARILADVDIQSFEFDGRRVAGARASNGTRFPAGTVLVAAGAWSSSLLAPLGISLSVKPVRGQIALFNTERPILSRIVHLGKRYLVPRSDGRLLAGSTQEDVGFDKRTTAEGIDDLLEVAGRICPALAGIKPERTWAGLRPASPDGKPFIGPVHSFEGLYVATGHFRSGLQLSPATGVLIRQLLLDQPLSIAIDDFRLDRPM